MTTDIAETITNAESRALATTGPHGVNVVPVSVVEVVGDEIHLFDFFMNKTVANLKADPAVTLTAWSGLVGIQVKAVANYQAEGELFETSVPQMKVRFPDRILSGVIVLRPTDIFDISAGPNAGKLLKSSGDNLTE